MSNEIYDASLVYFTIHGVDAEEKARILAEIAEVFVKDKKRTEKILRELVYDNVKFDNLEKTMLPYLSLERTVSGYKIMWEQVKKSFSRLQAKDPYSFEIMYSAVCERKFKFVYSGGIKTGNIFEDFKTFYNVENVHVDKFLKEIYNINSQIGKNPSGKAEYFLDIFVKGAYKSSDVNIDDTEYEIKTTNAPVGESLGSKQTYNETLKSIFEKSGEKFNYEDISFGKKNFSTKWAPVFIDMTKKSPACAYEFIKYQYEFFLQKQPNSDFIAQIDDFLLMPDLEKLAGIYDRICKIYIYDSLEDKAMIVFNENGIGEKRRATGEFVCFDKKSIEIAVSFAGSKANTPTKIVLPKSSATMRPEIQFNA